MLPYGIILLLLWYRTVPLGGLYMNIKVELLKNYISDYVNQNINDFEIDANKITDSVAIKVLFKGG